MTNKGIPTQRGIELHEATQLAVQNRYPPEEHHDPPGFSTLVAPVNTAAARHGSDPAKDMEEAIKLLNF